MLVSGFGQTLNCCFLFQAILYFGEKTQFQCYKTLISAHLKTSVVLVPDVFFVLRGSEDKRNMILMLIRQKYCLYTKLLNLPYTSTQLGIFLIRGTISGFNST